MAIKIEYAAQAHCTPDHVWRVFEHIELWPRWDHEAIREVRWVSGDPWSKGAKFTIELSKPGAFKLTPEVIDAEPPFYAHFRGKASGISGDQHFIFRWMAQLQSTELRTLQEFSGAPLMLIGKKVKPAIEAGIEHLFKHIISEAESLALSDTPQPPEAF